MREHARGPGGDVTHGPRILEMVTAWAPALGVGEKEPSC